MIAANEMASFASRDTKRSPPESAKSSKVFPFSLHSWIQAISFPSLNPLAELRFRTTAIFQASSAVILGNLGKINFSASLRRMVVAPFRDSTSS